MAAMSSLTRAIASNMSPLGVLCLRKWLISSISARPSDRLFGSARRRDGAGSPSGSLCSCRQTRARCAADHGDRATGPWEIEWIGVPEIFSLAAGALAQTRFMVSGQQVDERKMRPNLDITRG